MIFWLIFTTLVTSSFLVACTGEISGNSTDGNSNADTLIESITIKPVSGMVPLSVTVNAGNPDQDITSYQWNFDNGSQASTSTASVTYSAQGEYQINLTVRKNDNTTESYSETIHVVNNFNNASTPAPNDASFFDDFEYTVERNNSQYPTGIDNPFITNGGWNRVKSVNTTGSHNGYIYTVTEIPGYAGNFPGINSNRVLAIESLPGSMGSQTDFYLEYGEENGPDDRIPGDVWFQFWIYSNYFNDPDGENTQLSRYAGRMKFIYPCNGNYPCQDGQIKWLNCLGQTTGEPYWDNNDRRELYMTTIDSFDNSINYTGAEDYNKFKLGQTNTQENITRNRWTLVKIHYNTSSGQTPTYEAWMRPLGDTSWVQVADWRHGETYEGNPLNWSVTNAGGHQVFRIPTTVDDYDSWIYLDDFTMAVSENDLPDYNY